MDLVGIKVLVLFLIGILKLGAGLSPLALTKYLTKRRKLKCLDKFIGIVLCFGGGILLSTVFVHMIKEVRESIEAAIAKGVFSTDDLEYPFAELLICLGFLLILIIESVVHKFFGGHDHVDSSSATSSCESREATPVANSSGLDNQAFVEEDFHRRTSNTTLTTNRASHPGSSDHPDYGVAVKTSPFTTNKSGRNVYNVTSATLTSYTSYDTESLTIDSPPPPPVSRSTFTGSSNSLVRPNSILVSVRGFLVVMALSIHSLFEGMAIGLEETPSGVWKLFAAVIIHAIAIVFCIGTEMISGGTKTRTLVLYMVVLSINSPIGVAIGLIVTLHVETASGGHLLAVGILQGLAAGTLLYITFFEVLSRDKLTKYGMTGVVGAVVILTGFIVMAGSEAIGGHNHSHGGGQLQAGGGGLHHGHAHGVNFLHNQYEGDRGRTGILGVDPHHDHDHEHDHDHDDNHDHDQDHDHDHDQDHDQDHDHDHDHDQDLNNKQDHVNNHDSYPNHDHDHDHKPEHDHGAITEDVVGSNSIPMANGIPSSAAVVEEPGGAGDKQTGGELTPGAGGHEQKLVNGSHGTNDHSESDHNHHHDHENADHEHDNDNHGGDHYSHEHDDHDHEGHNHDSDHEAHNHDSDHEAHNHDGNHEAHNYDDVYDAHNHDDDHDAHSHEEGHHSHDHDKEGHRVDVWSDPILSLSKEEESGLFLNFESVPVVTADDDSVFFDDTADIDSAANMGSQQNITKA